MLKYIKVKVTYLGGTTKNMKFVSPMMLMRYASRWDVLSYKIKSGGKLI